MNSQIELVPVETDVLVIGGGVAGCMAAIRASERGVKVTIAEKSNTMRSGQTASGIDHTGAYIPSIHGKMGLTVEDLVEDHVQGIAKGFARREILHFALRESYNRVLDLERYGIKIRYEDSELPGKFRLVFQFHSVPSAFNYDGRPLKRKLTEEAKRRGVNIINRVMMTNLLSTDGEISGAVGVGTRDSKIYLFKAKGVVLCSGGKTARLSRELTGVDFNLHLPPTLAGDGKAMALHAGLEIMNMEFLGAGRLGVINCDISGGPPRNTWQPATSVVNHKGDTIVPRTYFYKWDDLKKGSHIDAAESRRKWLAELSEIHGSMPSGRTWKETGPFFLDCSGGNEREIEQIEWSLSNEGKGYQFLRHLKDERVDLKTHKIEIGLGGREMGNTCCAGLFVDSNFETEIKGLFAAGDEIGGVPFLASTGALTTGWQSGDMAAQRAKKQGVFLPVDMRAPEALRGLCADVLTSAEGCHWKEVEHSLQYIMDTYCGDFRTAPMLKRGIERLMETKNAPLKADDAHDLARCLEVRSLLDNAEMVLRASLAREESRGFPFFRRFDFPEQDEANWFAFSTIRLKGNEFKLGKIPIK
jgi:succinate dehydrogenase/fumarate reductase flavoprotein subunit